MDTFCNLHSLTAKIAYSVWILLKMFTFSLFVFSKFQQRLELPRSDGTIQIHTDRIVDIEFYRFPLMLHTADTAVHTT